MYKELLAEISKIEYPIRIESGALTLETLKSLFSDYNNSISKFSEYIGNGSVNLLNVFTDKLICIYIDFLKGLFKDAYIGMDSLISTYKDKLCIHSLVSEKYRKYITNPFCLYRSRTADSHVNLLGNQMSHISFKNRDIVGSNRYSAPGIPCLYLGSSSYLCWLEAGRPSFNMFNVCAFHPVNELTILDLTSIMEDLTKEIDYISDLKKLIEEPLGNCSQSFIDKSKAEIEAGEATLPKKIEQLLFTWPLALACGIKVTSSNERSRNFKEEYIIPQLLLQSLIQNEIDGIKYISTNIYFDCTNNSAELFVNYAFPAKENDETLIKHFSQSSVVNAANFQGITSLRNDVRDIAAYLRGIENTISNSMRGIPGTRGTSSNKLPSDYSYQKVPYSTGYGGFDYRDSVFSELETVLQEEVKSILLKQIYS